MIAQPNERRLDIQASGRAENFPQQTFDKPNDIVSLDKRGFQVDLGQFGDTIRAWILVPKAFCDWERA